MTRWPGRAHVSGRAHGLALCVTACLLVACNADLAGPELAFCATHPDTAVVTISDPGLELALRAELSVSPQSGLTCSMLAEVTDLSAAGMGIVSLEGIENLTGLTVLQIRANEITDIGPLRGLVGLTSLNLADNEIADVAPLGGLTNLTFLAINQNGSITDVGPLAGLTSLTGTLWMGENAITDLSPLGGLTGLTGINAWDNAVTDISGLSGMTGLTSLRVHINAITDLDAVRGMTSLRSLTLHGNPDLIDIAPLLDSPSLPGGGSVNLRDTRVSCGDVAALEANGVAVISDCP